jgi:hypothetical protein
MTPRQGLYVALVGLVIAVACGLLTYLLPQSGFVLWGFAGFVIMVVGLVMAAVATLVKGSGK